MFRITAKESQFFDVLIETTRISHEAAKKLSELVHSKSHFGSTVKEIEEIEHKGDFQVHSMLELLTKTFITPLDREDIFLIAREIDDITDLILSAAHLFQMINIRKVRDEAKKMAHCIVSCTSELIVLMEELKKQTKGKDLQKKVVEINRLENEGDRIYRGAVQWLFSKEKNAIEVIRWKEFYGSLEEVIDACENIANLVSGVVMKHA